MSTPRLVATVPPVCLPLEARTLLTAGAVDASFGVGGLARLDIPEFTRVFDMVTLSDGRIVAAVGFTHPIEGQPNQHTVTIGLVRLYRDGAADLTFGEGDAALDTGIHTLSWNVDLLAQPDDKLLLTDATTLARFNSDGSPDISFGTGGNGMIAMGAATAGLAIDTEGRILVGGSRSRTLYAQRFLPDGTPDNTFSYDSIATVRGASEKSPTFSGISAMPNGTIYLGCTWVVVPMGENTENAVYAYDIVHLRGNGTIDTAYGPNGNGIVERRMGVYIGMSGSMMVDSAERVLFGVMTDLRHMIYRYDRTGALDTTYGVDGAFRANSPSTTIDAQRMMIQHDGAVLAAGSMYSEGVPIDDVVSNPALARTTPQGTVDTAFGTDGRATVPLPGEIPPSNDRYSGTQAMTIAHDGSILIAARDRDGTFSAARLWRDDAPVAEFSAAPIEPPYARSLVFSTIYRDADDDIPLSQFGDRDLRITGPDGYVAYAKFDKATRQSDGRILARYKLGARGGVWDRADNGRYEVRLRGGRLADSSGAFASARMIGGFTVTIA